MDLLFTYWKKPGAWPSAHKVLRLPDAPSGLLAVALDNQRYLEIARVFQGEVYTSPGPVHEDGEALGEALVAFHEQRNRDEFKSRLDEFAGTTPAPDPVKLALFAQDLAEQLEINLADMADEKIARPETAAAA